MVLSSFYSLIYYAGKRLFCHFVSSYIPDNSVPLLLGKTN